MMTGESFYLDIDGEQWQYMLVTDPPGCTVLESIQLQTKAK